MSGEIQKKCTAAERANVPPQAEDPAEEILAGRSALRIISQTGNAAVAFVFRNAAAFYPRLIDGNCGTETERQFDTDFLSDRKFADRSHFAGTAASGGDDGSTAADGRAGSCFCKRNDLYGYTD